MRRRCEFGAVPRLPLLGLLLLGLLLLPACASSHSSVPIAEVRPGATVRVDTRPGPRYEGRLRLVEPESVHLAIEESALAVPRSVVMEMEVQRSRWKSGAQIGAGVLGVSAGAALSLLCLISRSDNGQAGDEGEWVDCALLGGLAGGVAGGLLGGLIGSSSKRWLPVRLHPD